MSLIANVGFHHILKWRPPFTKTEPYRWGLNLKFLYSSPVSPCLPDPLPSAAANQTWQRFEETLEREFIDGGGRKEGGVFKWRENVFSFFFCCWYRKDSHTQHALSTHFNNRPSSQIAALTPLISTDICRLSSLPPSWFFLIRLTQTGILLMASFFFFFGNAERGEIIKIIKPLGPLCAHTAPAHFFSSCL